MTSNAIVIPPGTGGRAIPSGGEKAGFVLFLLMALLLSWNPVAYVTGGPLSLAPFFYVLIARRWGLYPGLIAALVLSLPTVLWWDAWWYVFMSVPSCLCAHVLRRRGFLAAECFALFNMVAVPVLIGLMSWPQIPQPLIFLFGFQYAMGEILLAAMADVLIVNLVFARRFPFVIARKSRSIDRIIRTTLNAMLAFVLTISVANQAVALFDGEQQARGALREAAIIAVRGAIAAGRTSGEIRAQPGAGHAPRILFSDVGKDFAGHARAAMAPDCRWPLNVDTDHPYDDRYGTWISSCELVRDVQAGRPISIAIAYRDTQVYQTPWLSYRLLLLLLGAGLALAYRMSLSRSLLRTIRVCDDFVERFGTPNLPLPPQVAIRELDQSLRRFVERNNRYVAAIEERDRLTRAAVDLKRSVDLQLMGQIRFDGSSGILRFTEVRLSLPPVQRELQVHAADCPLFAAAAGSDEATIEFRTATWQDFDSLMITLRQNIGGSAWESGVMVKLSQPRRLRDVMVQQARLVDLGGMASAISHEIKQPLFTIAIAAESLQLMIDKGGGSTDHQMAVRIGRINEQVQRAREIIERISQYGRTDASPPSEIDAGEVMRIVHSFLTAMLDERGIAVTVEIASGNCKVLMSRIALEQVLVNAVQNAADSIEARRDAGWNGEGHITLEVGAIGRKVRCTIGDNGVGLSPGMAESAFNAFYTTKADDKGSGLGLFISRQIIVEAGGRIRLLPGDPEGALVELELPLSDAKG